MRSIKCSNRLIVSTRKQETSSQTLVFMHEQLRQQYLQAMGIQLWEARTHSLLIDEQPSLDGAAEEPEHEPVSIVVEKKDTRVAVEPPNWLALQQQVENCQQCGLHENRIFTVFGSGKQTARIMFVGEAPGAEEDRKGEPFVGSAGQLLNEMLMAIGFTREQVYIANILKCRPPNNRDPAAEEVKACESYLFSQIKLVQPEVIVALGRTAAHNLLKTTESLGALRGKLHHNSAFDTPVIATYHPAHLLRTPLEKREAWADLEWLLEMLGKKTIT